jgi:transcriptional regulator with XRE-family HTH domain
MTRILERYEDNLMGLPYPVAVIGSAEEVTDANGKVLGVAVPNAEGAAAAVALALCFMPVQLLGAEVRFIRRVLGMTGQQFAETLGMDPATLSRWEHDKQPVGEWAHKAVRWAAVLLLQKGAPGSHFRQEDIVKLKLQPRGNRHPRIEIHRVAVPTATEATGWDADMKLAA